ncbi:MAG: hypothetical protein OEY63_01490 [Gemmatimonadota bacterium]|nr:hypothetical protein [Gemmatimonadota bacterium]
MIYALSGGMWFHRHVHKGEPMAHVVSSDRNLLLQFGRRLGMRDEWLQYKPLKDPTTGIRIEAWHWDLRGIFLGRGLALRTTAPQRYAESSPGEMNSAGLGG